jgi:hypothetical protein
MVARLRNGESGIRIRQDQEIFHSPKRPGLRLEAFSEGKTAET